MQSPEGVFGAIEQFPNPEAEIAFLREQLQHRHEQAGGDAENHAEAVIDDYHQTTPESVLPTERQLSESEAEGISLDLAPEEHDDQIGGLYHVMLERGIRNTLLIVDRLGNPHLADDWHRFLVQYLIAGGTVPYANQSRELLKELDKVLFEITLPTQAEEGRGHRELIALMEQFYAGMQTITNTTEGDSRTYSLELALPNDGDDLVFFAGIPHEQASRFEKHVIGVFPNARVEVANNDYNIFSSGGVAQGAFAEHTHQELYPLKGYDQFESDPMSIILNTFSKLSRNNEGAALQIIIHSTDKKVTERLQKTALEIEKGLTPEQAAHKVNRGMMSKLVDNVFQTNPTVKEDATINQEALESIKQKVATHISKTNLRIVASAKTPERAQEILHDLSSAFHQFSEPGRGGLTFQQVKPRSLNNFLHSFTYRTFDTKQNIHLSYHELASLYHFPANQQHAPELKTARSTSAPAPAAAQQGEILLGHNVHRGQTHDVFMSREDRMRHFYIIGQTGTGKTGTMLNMIAQDIKNGEGVCYIDPHGSDVQTILSFIPKERHDDVIYFDPAATDRPMGLNMLEFDPRFPEQKTLIIDELMGIFNQLFDMAQQGGAMFQQYFKNSAFLVMDSPDTGNTLLEITRVLSDPAFRQMKLARCKNPIVRQFWENAEKTTGDQSLANFVPYISSKFDPLISNEILRPVIVQEKSAFNIRDIMDNKKILLVNLSKGRLGELNANLIGLILVGKIQMAALSRAGNHGQDLSDFFLYIDEFQNVTTPSIASILSEARKYRLSLNMAHQYLLQLSEPIRNAVLGNVGSIAMFRISPEDAQQLAPRIAPTFTADDIIKLDNRNCYLSMLADGQPLTAFNIKTANFPDGNTDQIETLKNLSRTRYGRPRDEVEAEIMSRYQNTPETP